MAIYYNIKIKIRKTWSLSIIPKYAQRTHPTWGVKQILSLYIWRFLLKPQLPKDAAVYIAITTSDLWPGRGWNFVFGEASLRDRVGVWSIYRYGDPHKNRHSYLRCLRRTIKVASHEVGHIFSVPHCKAYECNMCGTNSLQESDSRPMTLCPQCLAKVCWANQCNPLTRYRKLYRFYKKHGLRKEAAFYARSIRALRKPR